MNAASLLRLAGRAAVVALGGVVASLICLQFVRVIDRNVALAHELRGVEADVARLKVKRAAQEREIRRLDDPHGAIPEIHDRLHLVGDREAIIYLKGTPPPASEPSTERAP